MTYYVGKKLKRRLEELERAARSPSPEHGESAHKIDPESAHKQVSRRLLPIQYSPPTENSDELMFGQDFGRENSRTPPLFSYHSYPAPEDIVYPPYPQSQTYPAMITRGEHDYLAPVPVTLPSMMHFNEAIKREDDTIHPFNMYNQGLPAIDIHASYGCGNSNLSVSKVEYS
jgi:hypothetical protein